MGLSRLVVPNGLKADQEQFRDLLICAGTRPSTAKSYFGRLRVRCMMSVSVLFHG
jgi:hypothetical protein